MRALLRVALRAARAFKGWVQGFVALCVGGGGGGVANLNGQHLEDVAYLERLGGGGGGGLTR